MRHEITHAPAFALLRVDLEPGEQLTAEAGAMVARDVHMQMETTMNAGRNPGFLARLKAFGVALIRKVIGGETFFVNHFKANAPASVWLAPTMAGAVETYDLAPGKSIVLSTGAYVASIGDVDMKMRFGGLRGLFAKEGLFFLEMFGNNGTVWFNSYGGVEVIDVNGSYIVDNGHIVGFEGHLDFKIRTAGGGMMGFLASGEGLVCEFTGNGKVYLQARNVSALVGWLSRVSPR